MSADSLPKEKLLLKLLLMTTSDNDGEALTAIRKAKELLKTASWDWEKLLSAKITIVGDPFAELKTPPSSSKSTMAASAPPPPAAPAWSNPKPSAPPRPAQPQPQRARSAPQAPRNPISTQKNIYPGGCYCCGDSVDVGMGMVFYPDKHNRQAKHTICLPCNSSVDPFYIASSPAKRKLYVAPSGPAPSLNSL